MENYTQTAQDIENKIKQIFPNSHISVYYSDRLGKSITLNFGIGQNQKEWANGYFDNDPAKTVALIHINSDTSFELHWLQHNILCKPTEKHLCYSRIKTPARNTKGDLSKVTKAIQTYFERLPNVIRVNADKLCTEHLELFKSKNLIP